MNPIRVLSASEQVADYLKRLIKEGAVRDHVPGVVQLAKALGVNAKTVAVALQILEKEGVVINQGARRMRLISDTVLQEGEGLLSEQLHFCIFLYEETDRQSVLLKELEYALNEAGHVVTYAEKTLTELKMNLPLIQQVVKRERCDGWFVVGGSLSVLEWFSLQSVPAFALFGRRMRLAMASVGPKTDSAFCEAVSSLISFGHRRIVKICRSERRFPDPGQSERMFLELLRQNDIPVGEYNLPDWEETAEGYHELLVSLFRVTPPTAIIVDEPNLLLATYQFLAELGLRVPEDVSLVSVNSDSFFHWCYPTVSSIHWDAGSVVRRAVKWASNVANGKEDLEQTSTPAQFVMGGTIAQAKEEC